MKKTHSGLLNFLNMKTILKANKTKKIETRAL